MTIPLSIMVILFVIWIIVIKLVYNPTIKFIISGIILGFFSFVILIGIYLAYPLLIQFFNPGTSVLLEEIVKFVPCYYYLKKCMQSKSNALCLGSLVGLGFSFIENINYVGEIKMAIYRGTLSSGAHILFTMISAYGIWISFKNKNNIWIVYLLLSFFSHWIFNEIILFYW